MNEIMYLNKVYFIVFTYNTYIHINKIYYVINLQQISMLDG